MLQRVAYGLARAAANFALQLWPVWLFWFAWRLSIALWRDDVLAVQPDRATPNYLMLYRLWPTVGLAGPVLLMLIAIAAFRLQRASRVTAIAGIAGVALATYFTVRPEWLRLSAYAGRARPLDILAAVDPGVLWALPAGICAIGVGPSLVRGVASLAPQTMGGVTRARSDTYGHADWLAIKEAQQRFAGPDPAHGGIVIGEAYRVDQDRSARGAFDPADRRTWGQGGRADLLIDPCKAASTHGLVLAGSGGFKTTSTAIPTLLTWTGSAVVLDPAREIGPMVAKARQRDFGHRVVTLDPGAEGGDGFNVLDWIDPASPLAESNVEAVAAWLAGEPQRGGQDTSAEFFRDLGRSLITCLLANILWDRSAGADRTLRRLRQALVTPEAEMRDVLRAIHVRSSSALARDLAATLMGLVEETFSGVYANANKATRWLSTKAYADLVSGRTFVTSELADGRLTVFVQIPLKVLHSSPGLARVVIGALLNSAYEADGQVNGRILFLLDEAARLGPMSLLETARDAGRKYGLTLLLLYQSVGQLVEQWGRQGARAWYNSTAWRLYAAVQDLETARELSALCGEHGVISAAQGRTAGRQGRFGQGASASSGRSENLAEVKRPLIKPEELIQDTRADEAFVVLRGAKPLRCGRALYFRRPDMAARVAPSRFQPVRSEEHA